MNQSKVNTFVTTVKISAVSLAFLYALFRTLSLFLFFDESVGYFNNAAMPVIAYIVLGLGILIPVFYTAALPKFKPEVLQTADTDSRNMPSDPKRDFSALIPAVWFLCFIVTTCLWTCGNAENSRILTALSAVYRADKRTAIIIMLAIVMAFISIAYYLLRFFRVKLRHDLTALLGFFTVFFCIDTIVLTYLDNYVAMNSPLKMVTEFGLAAYMLSVIAELRVTLGKSAPRLRLLIYAVGTLVCTGGGLSSVIAGLAGRAGVKGVYLTLSFLLFGAGCYLIINLFRYTYPSVPDENSSDYDSPAPTAELVPDAETDTEVSDSEVASDPSDIPASAEQDVSL